ncbi:MAG: biotin--[acetyl-CoA-carboxylase] ligase [Wolbachia endosymbiont of Menacanthus eurysternus]|nr:MAG: biotin--[acetyl-CoA-carboxylase] ligase [Wolbachia endosymbiont of Menacanthus eurysternus]
MIFKKFDGFHIHYYRKVSSTNKKALDLINEGIISNETVIISDEQTNGRGRIKKKWISPKGNFYASFIIDLLNNRFNIISVFSSGIACWWNTDEQILHKLTELVFVVAIAVGDTLSLFIKTSYISYKWPNDILVDGKKISGILIEKKSNSNWLVIGIGININCTPLLGSTCISNYGKSISNLNLLKELILNFNKLRKQWICEGFYIIREMWMKKAFKINQQVSIRLSDKKSYKGIFIGIDKYGKLMLRQKGKVLVCSGSIELFINGIL